MSTQDRITVETIDGPITFDKEKVRPTIEEQDLVEVLELATEDGTPTIIFDGLSATFDMGGVLHMSAVVRALYEEEDEDGVNPDIISLASFSPSYWRTCSGAVPLSDYMTD